MTHIFLFLHIFPVSIYETKINMDISLIYKLNKYSDVNSSLYNQKNLRI